MNDLVLVFIAGIAGSIHCLGMCSPIAVMLSNFKGSKTRHLILYNSGRIFTYGFLGVIAGMLGENFHHQFESYNFLHVAASFLFGIILIIIGVKMFFNFQIRNIAFLSPISELFTQLINQSARSASIMGSFLTGIFNGFIPCPMIYAFLIKASSTFNPISGFEIMVVLGLGTFPGMFLLGRVILLKDRLASNNWLLRIAGLIVCYFGVMSIMRGISAGIVDNCCKM
ncbi:MAG: sulfite exporter TauE/SafE family protein [Nitrospirae bacterium]|nr:sulfite exporter TauE/SafE family protein [Nitrospirota bacterium]